MPKPFVLAASLAVGGASVLGVHVVRVRQSARSTHPRAVLVPSRDVTRRALVRPWAVEARKLAERARETVATPDSLPGIVLLYRRSLELEDDPFVARDLSRTLIANGRLDEARPLMIAFLAKLKSGQIGYASNDPGYALGLAEDAARLGIQADADAIVGGFSAEPIHQIDARFRLPELDHDPAHARANGLFAAGIGKLRVHRNAEAVPLFEEAVRERPDWGIARFMLAYAHAYAGHRAEADATFADAARFGWARPRGL